MMRIVLCAVAALFFAGCGGKEPGSTVLTKGSIRIGVDDAVYRVMESELEAFSQQYPDAHLTLKRGPARSVVSDFAADSLRVITLARALNQDERDALTKAGIQLQEYEVARTAIAVVIHPAAPDSIFRIGQLDSIFSGLVTRWPGKPKLPFELAVAGVNSSTTEIFRNVVITTGGGYDPTAKPFATDEEVLRYVEQTPGAIGIVTVDALGVAGGRYRVVSVSSPAMRPDSTFAPTTAYSPAAAYIFLGYYPITTPVYMYSREVDRNLALGFISYVSSAEGQKVFQRNGLVPMTMPVRLVHTTSQPVQ
jgi:phosphate transport system substrate-binding protein